MGRADGAIKAPTSAGLGITSDHNKLAEYYELFKNGRLHLRPQSIAFGLVSAGAEYALKSVLNAVLIISYY